jgi:hypothetical protein
MELTIDTFNRREVLQYLQWRGSDIPPDIDALIDRAIADTLAVIRPKYIWKPFALLRDGDALTLAGAGLPLPGQAVAELLADCDRCILLAATLGNGLEPLIRQAQARDLSRALVLDACGSAAIEAVCDEAERLIGQAVGITASGEAGGGLYFTDRFSPGYGDLPLSLQPDLTSLLDTSRQIGLTLTDSLILLPRKSVTAILGLASKPQVKRFRGCAYCSMFASCAYRKAGKTCGRT